MQQPMSIARLNEIEQIQRAAARRARTPEARAAHTATADIAQEYAHQILSWLWEQGSPAKDSDIHNFGFSRHADLDYRLAERSYGDFLIVRRKRHGAFVKLIKRTGYYG